MPVEPTHRYIVSVIVTFRNGSPTHYAELIEAYSISDAVQQVYYRMEAEHGVISAGATMQVASIDPDTISAWESAWTFVKRLLFKRMPVTAKTA